MIFSLVVCRLVNFFFLIRVNPKIVPIVFLFIKTLLWF